MTNIKKFPVTTSTRIKNRRGKNSVSCVVTDRWLVFDEESILMQEGETFFISVMTDISGKPRQLCHLAITKEDVLRALENVKLKK